MILASQPPQEMHSFRFNAGSATPTGPSIVSTRDANDHVQNTWNFAVFAPDAHNCSYAYFVQTPKNRCANLSL